MYNSSITRASWNECGNFVLYIQTFLHAHLYTMRGFASDKFAFGLGKPSFRFCYSAVNEVKDDFESGVIFIVFEQNKLECTRRSIRCFACTD